MSRGTKDHLSRSFDWHNATQFFGAINDNIFQMLLIFFLIGLLGRGRASGINAIAGIVFVVPFLIFTPAAGTLVKYAWPPVLSAGTTKAPK